VVALLDANVLIALFDPSHVHHGAAHRWFASNRRNKWATCALTENALVRILSNPSYPGVSTTISDAAIRLRTFCATEEHVFWKDSLSLRETGRFHWHRVHGHRQITDLYLLALSVIHQGKLATFDSAISLRAVADATSDNLELLAV
jgi:toxin-antitoxin system PIN domain toxin